MKQFEPEQVVEKSQGNYNNQSARLEMNGYVQDSEFKALEDENQKLKQDIQTLKTEIQVNRHSTYTALIVYLGMLTRLCGALLKAILRFLKNVYYAFAWSAIS